MALRLRRGKESKDLAAHEEFIMTRAGITLVMVVEGKKTRPGLGLGLGGF
jgi:hypothetical protein